MVVPDYSFGTVENSDVRSYEPKFNLYIEKHMYVRIHIPRPLPLGESRPNNKVRKKCVFLKLIFISSYYYVCKNILNFSEMQQKTYLATNSAGLLCGIWGCSSPMAMAVLLIRIDNCTYSCFNGEATLY